MFVHDIYIDCIGYVLMGTQSIQSMVYSWPSTVASAALLSVLLPQWLALPLLNLSPSPFSLSLDIFKFDNSYSWMRAKEIYYTLQQQPPVAEQPPEPSTVETDFLVNSPVLVPESVSSTV